MTTLLIFEAHIHASDDRHTIVYGFSSILYYVSFVFR